MLNRKSSSESSQYFSENGVYCERFDEYSRRGYKNHLRVIPWIKAHRNMKSKYLLSAILLLPIYAQAVEVNKAEWIDAMSTALPTAFCNSSQYFRQCFSITAHECEETAASATRICLSKNSANIPHVLHQPKDGTHWGTIIGKCAGEAFEASLASKRINNSKCNDINNWQ